jgi:hypothetical protein
MIPDEQTTRTITNSLQVRGKNIKIRCMIYSALSRDNILSNIIVLEQ